MLPRLWLLDRDGVLNERIEGGYVLSRQQWRTLDGVEQALALMRAGGAHIAVVTNQACVGKGLTTQAEVDALHIAFNADLSKGGVAIDRFFVCPHRAEDRCGCRKPAPGLILQALADYGVVAAEALLIGDSASDMLAAERAGVRGVQARGDGGLLLAVKALMEGEGLA